MKRARVKTFKPVRANLGIQAAYRAWLETMIAQMQASVAYWLTARFREHAPLIAMDALPANELRREMRKLTRQWQSNFDEAAPALARWFARSVDRRSTLALRKILKEGGFTVELKMTAGHRDVLNASITENVSLIKSIPQQYLTQVEGLVMRSVQTGRDLGSLSRQLQSRYGITKRRAALIARDQNNKATAVLTRERQLDLGLTQAIWRHSRAGKEPRPKHLAADGTRYDVRKGLRVGDKGDWVLPGVEINCRCYSEAIVPGFGT